MYTTLDAVVSSGPRSSADLSADALPSSLSPRTRSAFVNASFGASHSSTRSTALAVTLGFRTRRWCSWIALAAGITTRCSIFARTCSRIPRRDARTDHPRRQRERSRRAGSKGHATKAARSSAKIVLTLRHDDASPKGETSQGASSCNACRIRACVASRLNRCEYPFGVVVTCECPRCAATSTGEPLRDEKARAGVAEIVNRDLRRVEACELQRPTMPRSSKFQ